MTRSLIHSQDNMQQRPLAVALFSPMALSVGSRFLRNSSFSGVSGMAFPHSYGEREKNIRGHGKMCKGEVCAGRFRV